ncbi:MAG: hypothetical protein DRJ61_15730 [Acidobacteria bacterium]|nr:MAG: hypothetical protein DRJ65_21405 [Acidobacteriota bacterium]RLE28804.1 MAG: hypothetical protein DRJ61_15730 [Acidobacteriota bacterium]
MRVCLISAFTVVAVLSCAATAAAAGPRLPTLLYTLKAEAPDLNPVVLELALEAADCAWKDGEKRRDILSVIDYSLPSVEPRLWVFDMNSKKLIYKELVAHGVGSGEFTATKFSNQHGTKQSSLGLFRTGTTYFGQNGYSLKLHGLEEGVNHKALARTIVIHGAWYVSENFGKKHGRMGRSWGCPALDPKVAKPLIDTIKEGTLLFVYYPDLDWLNSSIFLRGCGGDSSISP